MTDLTTLAAGTRLGGRSRTITESDLVSFAALTGDWHPQHSDAEWAAYSRFGERIAHGMLVLSYSIGLMGFDPERVVALRGFDSVTFKRPVAIGDTIRVEAESTRRRPLDEEHELVTLGGASCTGDDRLALRARVTIVHRTRQPTTADVRRLTLVRRSRSGATVTASEALYGERVLL